MATIVADSSGNWSDTGTWAGDAKPGASDIAQTGAYTVTIDENVTCSQLNPTSSGHFEVTSGGITINAAVVMGSTYTSGGVRCTHTTGTVTINGNITGGSTASADAVLNSAAGTLTITGTVQGGSALNSAVKNSGGGTCNITGNVTGGTSQGRGATNDASTMNITGDVAGSSGTNSYGVYNNGTAPLTITGNATGGSSGSGHGVYNNGGTVTISGTATGSVGYGAYNILSTGSLSVDQAIGGGTGTNIGYGLYGSNAAGTTTYKRIGSVASGAAGYGGHCKMVVDADYNVINVRDSAGNEIAMSNDYPAVTDVKSGVVYNRTTLTGTYTGGGGGFQQSGQGFGFKR